MKIQIIGSGCEKCKKLYERTKEAVLENGIKAEVEYVTDLVKIMEMGIMTTPVLIVNGKALSVGRLPEKPEIKEILQKEEI